MREVAPGDMIFSFRDTRIAALGIARSYCYESPKPTEFGAAGSYWEAIAWKIDVGFRELNNRILPKSHIGELRGLLPEKYSPLRANGDGLQSVYLAEVGRPFAAALFRLIGGEANKVADVAKEVERAEQLGPSREPDLERWEERVEHDIREDPKIPETQREAIIQARVGQGRFRANVQGVERGCRVTKVERLEYLVPSHTKPWRVSTNVAGPAAEIDDRHFCTDAAEFRMEIVRPVDPSSKREQGRGAIAGRNCRPDICRTWQARHDGFRASKALRNRDESPQSGRAPKPRTVSGRLRSRAYASRGYAFKITICDLERRPRLERKAPATGLHRARRHHGRDGAQ
jgi:hypothetical protein